MKFKVFIGIDVSKKTLDFTVLVKGEKVLYKQTKNTAAGILGFHQTLDELGTTYSLDLSSCLYCLEHTGVYTQPFLDFAGGHDLKVWLEDASKIRSFYGISREKNDKVDSLMIAEYSYMKREKLQLWEKPRALMMRLKNLLATRERLVQGKTRLLVPSKEAVGFMDKSEVAEQQTLIAPIIDQMNKKIKEIEKKIHQLIQGDQTLKALYLFVTSVKGIGLIIASNMLVVTNEFKLISEAKKMACHCGVAPFKRKSGTSLNGKAKVSHRANKSMKKLLNLGARSAVGSPGELRDYYLKKVAEGKNKMAVLNAVRNKLIHRVFACVRDRREYENSYQHALA